MPRITDPFQDPDNYHKTPYHPEPWNPRVGDPRIAKKPSKPEPTLSELLPRLDKFGIGFEGILSTLTELTRTGYAVPSFPPYDITKFEDGKWQIDMALAGFSKEDLEITVSDRRLTVSNIDKEDDLDAPGKIVHNGIAKRDFTTTFSLAEYVEVDSAKMKDGVLTIKLVTNLPENKRPKSIDIK